MKIDAGPKRKRGRPRKPHPLAARFDAYLNEPPPLAPVICLETRPQKEFVRQIEEFLKELNE